MLRDLGLNRVEGEGQGFRLKGVRNGLVFFLKLRVCGFGRFTVQVLNSYSLFHASGLWKGLAKRFGVKCELIIFRIGVLGLCVFRVV